MNRLVKLINPGALSVNDRTVCLSLFTRSEVTINPRPHEISRNGAKVISNGTWVQGTSTRGGIIQLGRTVIDIVF